MVHISCFTGGIAETNGYLVETSLGRWLVDAPEGVTDWLKEKGVTQIDLLLLTHQHFDHCQDAARVKEELGARICAFAPFSRQLTLEFLMGFVSGSRFEVKEFVVDELLEGKATVEVLGEEWQLAHVPGHAVDSVTFYQPQRGLLLGGDVLFAGSVGRTDFPNGSMKQLIDGIHQKLLVLPDETRVLPGHGGETTIGRERETNPYL